MYRKDRKSIEELNKLNKKYDDLYKSMIGRSFKEYIQYMLISDDERKANRFLSVVDPELLQRYYTPGLSPIRVIAGDDKELSALRDDE